jgi:hypothetical protein
MYPALLTAIALWISANFDLPANFPLPNVELVSAQEIAFLRNGAFTSAQQREIVNQEQQTNGVLNRRQAVAVYDDLSETIFLPDNWKAIRPPSFLCWFMRWSITFKRKTILGTSAKALARSSPTRCKKSG